MTGSESDTADRNRRLVASVLDGDHRALARVISRSPGRSSSGMIPPTTNSVSAKAPYSSSPSTTFGTRVLWAPERIEIPSTSTSSWTAAWTISSGARWSPE